VQHRMVVTVIRTHSEGRAVDPGRLEQQPAARGDLRVHLGPVAGLRRAARTACLALPQSSRAERVLPDLHDVELIALADRAMMLTGFEEVLGRRFYQGWWIRWN
jgi:hypothetical protein